VDYHLYIQFQKKKWTYVTHRKINKNFYDQTKISNTSADHIVSVQFVYASHRTGVLILQAQGIPESCMDVWVYMA
jgi:hypothetical protein